MIRHPLSRQDVSRLLEKWGRSEPLNRDDILKLIEENGGMAKELDLSLRVLQGVDLSRLDISGAILKGADLRPMVISKGSIVQPSEEYSAALLVWDLMGQQDNPEIVPARLQGSILKNAQCQGARLQYVRSAEADFNEADFRPLILEILQNGRMRDVGESYEQLMISWLSGGLPSTFKVMRATFRGACLVKTHFVAARLQGLDLSGAVLNDADLVGARLERAQFHKSDLRGADLVGARLERAEFDGSDLRGADLSRTDLEGASLVGAKVENAQLAHASLSWSTRLDEIKWGRDFILGDELRGDNHAAEKAYRVLKLWHQNHGYYDVAGEFHYREWVCRRKGSRKLSHVVPLAIYEHLTGYGERPWRVVRAACAVIGLFSLAYFPYGNFDLSFTGVVEFLNKLWGALYFSGASFTALGYGACATLPLGWTRQLGVVESIIGIFLMALFLVTFTRKMLR